MADSTSYGQRVRATALRQTLFFTKAKLLVAVIMAIILSLVRWVFGKAQVCDLFRDIAIVIGSYLFFGIVVYLWNLFCAPGLLEKERLEEIASLTTRAEMAETAANSNEVRKKLVIDFSKLMTEGKAIGDRISQLLGAQLADWDSDLKSWKQRVTDFMNTNGWQTEEVPFLQAADTAEPVQGPVYIWVRRERRRRKMALYNQKLDDIAKRRIASVQ
jgi:hypothetical protein